MYRIKTEIIEKLREQGLNADVILEEYADVRKHKIEENTLRTTKHLNEKIRILEDVGMTVIEIIQFLENADMIIEKEQW